MRPLILTSALLLAASVTSAQTPLFSVEGAADRDWFGFKTRSAGDVNADGRDDLIVNNVIMDGPNFSAYVVRVLSGENGRVLYEYADEAAPRFGWGVSGRTRGPVGHAHPAGRREGHARPLSRRPTPTRWWRAACSRCRRPRGSRRPPR